MVTWEEFWDCHVYPHLIACTGWTWEYIDEHMTLPRWYSMQKYWEKAPPMHLLVRDYLGYKPKENKQAGSSKPPAAQQDQQYGTLEDLVADFSAAGGIVNL